MALVPVQTATAKPAAQPAVRTTSSPVAEGTSLPEQHLTAQSVAETPEQTAQQSVLQAPPAQIPARPLNKSAALYRNTENAELVGLRRRHARVRARAHPVGPAPGDRQLALLNGPELVQLHGPRRLCEPATAAPWIQMGPRNQADARGGHACFEHTTKRSSPARRRNTAPAASEQQASSEQRAAC